jgi:hypothetical protein
MDPLKGTFNSLLKFQTSELVSRASTKPKFPSPVGTSLSGQKVWDSVLGDEVKGKF